MYPRTALVAATSLLSLVPSTTAFLIPPHLAEAASEASKSWNELIYAAPRTLDVACHGCPFIVEETAASKEQLSSRVLLSGFENNIHLEFTSNNGEVQINNATIFPFDAVNDHPPFITVQQTRVDNGEVGAKVPVDFSVAIGDTVKPHPRYHKNRFDRLNDADNKELIPMTFAIFGLDGKPVNVEAVHIDVIREQDGSYTIARLRSAPIEPVPDADACEDSANLAVCRTRAIIAERIHDMLAHAQERASRVKEWMKTHANKSGQKGPKHPCPGRGGFRHGDKDGKGRFDGKHHNGHGPHPHGHHRGHHRGHRMAHIMHHILANFVIPAVLGVVGGLIACALGMLVGQTIAFLWFRFGRGGRRGQVENIHVYEVAFEDDEKDGLMHGEDLPRYEDAPEYEHAPKYEDVEDRA